MTSRFRNNSVNNKIYVMYHATDCPASVETIIRSGFYSSIPWNTILGEGVYVFRQEEKAQLYGDYCLKLLVNPGNCRVVRSHGDPLQKTWQRYFDSAWIPPNSSIVRSAIEEHCIANPRNIRVLGLVRGHEWLSSETQSLVKPCTSDSLSESEYHEFLKFSQHLELFNARLCVPKSCYSLEHAAHENEVHFDDAYH